MSRRGLDADWGGLASPIRFMAAASPGISAQAAGSDDLRTETGDSYVFINSGSQSFEPARVSESFPGSKVIFASQGKLLVEIPDGPLVSAGDSITQGPEFVHLIRAKDTRLRALSELVA